MGAAARVPLPAGAAAEVAKMRTILAARRPAMFTPVSVWARMPIDARCLLVTVATQRSNIEQAAASGWATFTADEQVRLSAAARALRRGLDHADWLR